MDVAAAHSGRAGLARFAAPVNTACRTHRYRQNGQRRELTLGNYPDISLSEARKLASFHRAAVDGGADPAKEKTASKQKAATIEWTIERLSED